MKLYKVKGSNNWRVHYMLNGKRVRQSLGTDNKKEAQALVAKLEHNMFMEKNFDKKPDYSFKEALAKYMKGHSILKKSHQRNIYFAKSIRPYFCQFNLADISTSVINDYMEQRRIDGLKEASIRRELDLVKAILNKACKEWEWLDKVPNFPKMKINNTIVRWATLEERKAIIDVCPEHLRPVVITAFETGGRISEVLSLQWTSGLKQSHVDLENRFVRFEETKNGKPRSIPMSDVLYKLLVGMKKEGNSNFLFTFKGKPIKSIKTSFKTALKRSGVENFRIHDMRHTFASYLVQNGASLQEVKELLGHSSMTMVMRYAHLKPDNLRNAINRLPVYL